MLSEYGSQPAVTDRGGSCASEHGTITAIARPVAAPGPEGLQTLDGAWSGSLMCGSFSPATARRESHPPLSGRRVCTRRSERVVSLPVQTEARAWIHR